MFGLAGGFLKSGVRFVFWGIARNPDGWRVSGVHCGQHR
jgi:hypothetical protein